MKYILATIIFLLVLFILCSALPLLHCLWVNWRKTKNETDN